jgi:hypothetical protein
MILICDNCGERFNRSPSCVFPDRHAFCTESCFREFQAEGLAYDDILAFIIKYVLEHGGVSPTYREIIDGSCKTSSTSHVKHVLNRLAENGLITLLGNGKSRGIQVTGMQLSYTDPGGKGRKMPKFDRMMKATAEFPSDTRVRIEIKAENGYAIEITLEELRELVALRSEDDDARDETNDYWMKYCVGTLCSLCGNSGIIDTTGVTSAAGILVGRKNYCICPNGQSMRKQEEAKL